MSKCQFYKFSSLTVLLIVITAVQAKSILSITEARRYLSKYGYLPATAHNAAINKTLENKILNNTVRDVETMALMLLPHCGVHDKVNSVRANRVKRYELQGSHWLKKNLTYKILSYPSSLRARRADVDSEIGRAFSLWSNNSGLTFTYQQHGKADIEILFAAGEHGDSNPFDGPGGVLGHGFFPEFGGQVHFDDAEYWTIGNYSGTNLYQAAAHEIGHALGLSHSNDGSALMSLFYRGYNPNLTLDPDDISGIQAMYGKKYTPRDNQLCKDPSIDAIFNSAKGETYVFKGDVYYMLSGNSVVDGYPKNISEKWKGLPSNIDGAFTHSNGNTYFFKDTKYWIYRGDQMDSESPRYIYSDYALPGYFDAVMFCHRTLTTYFFSGRLFWTFDINDDVPKPYILYWRGLPNNLDAAFEDKHGNAYFFKDDKYYRLKNETDPLHLAVVPQFPRPISENWFGCEPSP